MPDTPPVDTAPRVLLWDVMDTLVHDPFHDALPAFFGGDLATLVEHKHPTAWIDFERGAIDAAEYYRTMFADGRAVDGGALERCMRDAYRWIDGMEDLLRRLCARGLELHALSNYPTWYEMIEERLQLSRYLSWRFVSCRTGVRKPAPEAWTNALSALGRDPRECLFIDDRRRNCIASEMTGVSAVLFTDARSLEAALLARGVL
jgi:HAD superfamily hydrolase (TIGR01509 family)